MVATDSREQVIIKEKYITPETTELVLPLQVVEVDLDQYQQIKQKLSEQLINIPSDNISTHSIRTPAVNECASSCLIAIVFEPDDGKVHQAHLYPDAVNMIFTANDNQIIC